MRNLTLSAKSMLGDETTRTVELVVRLSLFLLPLLMWSLLGTSQVEACEYPLLKPISIDGTAQLRQYASRGEGSPAKPFLVEGLRIDAAGAPYCIEIRNVSDHFVIRDCCFTGASESALILDNVRNGWVVDSVIEDSKVGITCLRGTRGVVFAGNTFRGNVTDARLEESSVSWDDGYMGNYWDGYRGFDRNGDGIGDTPYVLKLTVVGTEAVADRFPLLEAIAGTSAQQGRVLLRVSYTAGEVLELRSSRQVKVSTVILIFQSAVEASTEQRIRQRVLTSPGTGFFTLEEAVIEDSGTVLADGVPQPYESSAGTTTIRRTHRLGVMTEPGHGMIGVEMAGVDITAQLPARRVGVGDRWTASWSTDAGALGWESGEQRTTATFLLDSFELVNGDLCAVIRAEARTTLTGTDRDPMLGAVSLAGKGVLNTTVHFSLARGRIIRQVLTGTVEMTASASGFVMLRQRMELSVTAAEVVPGAEEQPTASLTPLPEELMRAFVLLVSGDFPGAEEAARRAAERYRAAGQTDHEANALFVMADAQMRQEKYREAIATLERALPLYELGGVPHDLAACLNGLGLCHRRLGNHAVALEYYERMVAVAPGDPEVRSTGLVNMGNCLIALGDYTKAIGCLEDARRLRTGRDVTGEINTLNSLAICYRKLGQYSKALEMYNEALALCSADTPGFWRPTLLGNKGTCYVEQGDLEQGLALLLQAQRAWAEIGERMGEAAAWIRIAACQRRLAKPAAAMASLERALSLSRTSDIVAAVNFERGWCYLDLGDPASALDYFRQAREWIREGGDLEALWRCDWGLAKSWWGTGDLARAKEGFERALSFVEKARAWVEEEEARKDYFRTVQGLYEDYLAFLFETGQSSDMLWIAERCRARTFLDLLAKGPIRTLQHVREGGIMAGVVDSTTIRADLSEVIAGLPAGTAAVEYFVAEKAVYIWVISRDEMSRPLRIEIDRPVLLDRVREFRVAIETPPARGREMVALLSVLGQAGNLYELLLAPIEEKVVGFDHLVILPSGPLYYLPFAALYRCPGCEDRRLMFGGTYLGERFTLSYLPSLTLLKYAHRQGDRTTGDAVFLGFGNPDGTLPAACEEVQAIAVLFPAREAYCGMEATEELVYSRSGTAGHVLFSTHGIFNPYNPLTSYLVFFPTGHVGREDGKLYAHEVFGLGLQADLVTLSACETLLPSLREAERQVRAVRGVPEGERTEVPPALLEEITAGDELVGLTRAFIYAGTPTVLATLWSVYSGPTKDLMVRFYQLLGEGKSKAEALQQAQRELRQIYPHPVYWAAFQLVGDWR